MAYLYSEEDPQGQAEAPLIPREQKPSPLVIFFKDARNVFIRDELGLEIFGIALPAALALTADPLASLVDTAFIGQIGAVEVAAVGVSIALFNQVSRIAIFPLVSITTSFVAEEDAASKMANEEPESGILLSDAFSIDNEMEELMPQNDPGKGKPSFLAQNASKRRHIPSATSALVVGGLLGLLQTIILIFSAKPLLNFMGVKHDSPMLIPACRYLTIRSLGAPAVLLSLAMQGVFRGFKDTKTPLYATVAGDATNIILDPILMFVFRLGVSGAAMAHIISQYLIALILMWRLLRMVNVLPPSIEDLQLRRFVKNGLLLLVRVIAVTFCVTLAASMAARQGAVPMAAFQICLQVWLASSLLADGLAVSGQAIIASSFARNDKNRAIAAASRVLQLGLALGFFLSIILWIGLRFGARLFTKDTDVLHLIHIGTPFVAATQPINALAFIFDGINFGATDYAYSAYSMLMVAIVSIVCVLFLSWSSAFVGIWIALTIYMSLRMFAGFWRIGTARGPWIFLRT